MADYGKPGNYFERQIGRWSKQYLASVTEPITEMDRLIEWLPAHLPAGALDAAQVAVVHGDFRLDNLVFDRDTPRVIAVLDWELSTTGHPLADFSYHCMAWHIPPGVFRGIARRQARWCRDSGSGSRRPDRRWSAGCRRRSGC